MRPIGHRLEHPCPECEAPMVLKPGAFGLFYGCTKWPDCNGTHGAHQDTGEPLGVPATRDVKQARIEAHEVFDTLWRNNPSMSRDAAYRWMREKMGLSAEEAHIGRFDKMQCERLIALVEDEFANRGVE